MKQRNLSVYWMNQHSIDIWNDLGSPSNFVPVNPYSRTGQRDGFVSVHDNEDFPARDLTHRFRN